MKKMSQKKLITMVETALLGAIIVVMAFTPLGYLRTATGLEITFIMIPVVIGAATVGPSAGAILGGVFGITSFVTRFCFWYCCYYNSILCITISTIV